MTRRQRAIYWGPALGWVVLIFFWSTDLGSADRSGDLLRRVIAWLMPDLAATLSQEQLRLLNGLIRKTGHVAEYFVLACLLVRAQQSGQQRIALRTLVYSAVAAAAVACLDELYQSLMPSRTAALRDVLIDTFGAAAGCIACAVFFWLKQLESRMLEAASDDSA